jgi:biopolymer transport protein TolQ
MTLDTSILQYFLTAGLVVKIVMLILFFTSFISWVFIFQRWFFLQWSRKNLVKFERIFWQTDDLGEFYQNIADKKDISGLEKIFCAGFKEFVRLHKKSIMAKDSIINSVQRAMRVAYTHEADKLEQHLPFLATVGSISPYIGLFGTVWGIMTAFQALGHVQQATIAMVAPGIAEALIATALGLFAAIPAVIAYNRYTNTITNLLNRYESFAEEFSNYLLRVQD